MPMAPASSSPPTASTPATTGSMSFSTDPRCSRRSPTTTAAFREREHRAFDSGFGAACQRHGPQRAAAVDHRGQQSEQRHGHLQLRARRPSASCRPTGYTGPASFTYTITDGRSGTASANVSLTVTPPPPVANNDSGFMATENTAVSIAASALLANDTDPNGLPLSISGVSNPINGTVSLQRKHADRHLRADRPATPGPPALLTRSPTRSGGVASANVSLTVNNPPTAQSLFYTSDTPATGNGKRYQLGGARRQVPGLQRTARSRGSASTRARRTPAPMSADLWRSTGTLLATATFTNETASGWQQVNFATPVAITAGTTYVASYHTSGDYSADGNYFATAHTSGALTAPASGTSGGDGVYAYGTGVHLPDQQLQCQQLLGRCRLRRSARSAAGGQQRQRLVATENTTLSIPASTLLANDTDPNGLPLSIAGVSNPSHGTVTYNASTQTRSASCRPPAIAGRRASPTRSPTVKAPRPRRRTFRSRSMPLPPVANNDSGFATAR